MKKTPKANTYSGEPPQTRSVGDVISAWENTYRPTPKQSFFKRLRTALWESIAINL